ncbi:hypothetical protein [Myxococcus stipitatus]|uniref:hypothetical protein n=1 Tax=Myxococcus stipitatus TaxID=83455 RepID=UPI0030D51776
MEPALASSQQRGRTRLSRPGTLNGLVERSPDQGGITPGSQQADLLAQRDPVSRQLDNLAVHPRGTRGVLELGLHHLRETCQRFRARGGVLRSVRALEIELGQLPPRTTRDELCLELLRARPFLGGLSLS